MILVANSCLAILLCSSNLLWMNIITLHNDIKQIESPDSLCIFRGYLTYVTFALNNYSFLSSAFHRYLSILYSTCLFWQFKSNQFLFICCTWIFAILFPMAFIFTGDIIYNIDNQICQVILSFSFPIIFLSIFVYFMPVLFTMLIYWKLILYVKEMSRRVISTNVLFRAQRELKMVRRTVILLLILITIGFPYAIFIFMSFFTSPPLYHFRIAYIFAATSVTCVPVALFQFTDPLKAFVISKLNIRPNAIGLTAA
ncbi:unnamed protein product [Adineta ricciae]|uniref:G-protein coupled receptors family 1 profile domain-containing protein n=1 Tax=Adineta ricciae TaxID=249248 RepID=A0A814Y5L9_ADIRI|nr:unnamed protein product [Adineta ricciae]CAF1437612.1 unnamed protein product [Adineta ricciae]